MIHYVVHQASRPPAGKSGHPSASASCSMRECRDHRSSLTCLAYMPPGNSNLGSQALRRGLYSLSHLPDPRAPFCSKGNGSAAQLTMSSPDTMPPPVPTAKLPAASPSPSGGTPWPSPHKCLFHRPSWTGTVRETSASGSWLQPTFCTNVPLRKRGCPAHQENV